ncbi:DUF4192 domain-containing protein [Saccharothrix sp. Mg75]|uniref:DUF4192 domain-containing protein n=1 Tax=Saccharothrix sp. Mg75 TaxID=3445357 RepID=UPI003EE91DA1
MSDPTPEPTPSSSTSPLDQVAPATLTQPGDLIAAAPHLMGYYPADAVVINVLAGATITMTMCFPLPSDTLTSNLIGQVTVITARHPGAIALGVVVGGGEPDDDLLPRDALVAQIRAALAEHDMPLHMFWTSTITAGARWHDYDDPTHTGTVPDPNTSVLAVTSVMQGQRTFGSRDDLTATLRPDPQEALARRASLIDQLVGRHDRPRSTNDSYRLVMRYVKRTATRSGALSDQDVAALAVALSDSLVRDSCIATAAGEHARAAERLWTELTRQCPAPQCAEPAALLAMSAYLRGDGVLTSLALDRAETARPGHRLAGLLRTALDLQMPPEALRPLVHQAVEDIERRGLIEPE